MQWARKCVWESCNRLVCVMVLVRMSVGECAYVPSKEGSYPELMQCVAEHREETVKGALLPCYAAS